MAFYGDIIRVWECCICGKAGEFMNYQTIMLDKKHNIAR
jgi:hypothetical protein